jgi:hypothetical protein
VSARARAVAEVLLTFAAMHVAFRAVKRFTALGRWELESGANFSPGVAMIAVALCAIALHRRRARSHERPEREAWGLAPRPTFGAALLACAVLGLFGATLGALGVDLARSKTHWNEAAIAATASIAATGVVLWILSRTSIGTARATTWLGRIAFVALPTAPIVFALWNGRDGASELLTVLWLLVGAGVGEELFFRGYVQSRLNQVFGRPWRAFGVDFGPGLFLAAALFGLVHVLNPTDYFAGVYRFAWPHGLATAATLYYGFLRERTGCVWVPALVHFVVDVLSRWPTLVP